MTRSHTPVAIVTGAGGTGCGRALAARFARDGAAVVVSDVNDAGGAETVRLIAAEGGTAAFCRTDVRDEQQVRDLITFGERTFGGVTVLINNASAPYRPGEPLEHWADTVQTDLLGAVFGTRHAIDAMRRAGGGAVVNIASISALWHGRKTPGVSPAYDTAKAGMIRLTTTLAGLAESDGIRVNCLAPGWIRAWCAFDAPEHGPDLRRGGPPRDRHIARRTGPRVVVGRPAALRGVGRPRIREIRRASRSVGRSKRATFSLG